MKKVITLTLFIISVAQIRAQEKKILDSINFYGALPIQVAVFDKK